MVRDIEAGQRLLEARLYGDSQNPPRLAAEAVSYVSVPYPLPLLALDLLLRRVSLGLRKVAV